MSIFAFASLTTLGQTDCSPRRLLSLFVDAVNDITASYLVQYWQIEFDDDPISGEAVEWNDRIRLRHFTTRRYLILTFVLCIALSLCFINRLCAAVRRQLAIRTASPATARSRNAFFVLRLFFKRLLKLRLTHTCALNM